MLDASTLFYSTVESPTLLAELELAVALREQIKAARQTIRDLLRVRLPVMLRAHGCEEAAVTPRFHLQGSGSYGTLNSPAQRGQQADIDEGTYLPVDLLQGIGTPRQASGVYFRSMELSLVSLETTHRWKLDRSKNTCVRVILNELIHVDLPLYVIPKDQFVKMAKSASGGLATVTLDAYGLDDDLADVWESLPLDKVMLAQRDGTWRVSDARPVRLWFLAAVDHHGEQLSRAVRYIKALRDWYWLTDGPSSLLLMAAVVRIFTKAERRDDLALLDVLERLPAELKSGVAHPTDPSESLTDRYGTARVDEAASRFETTARDIRSVLGGACAKTACSELIQPHGSCSIGAFTARQPRGDADVEEHAALAATERVEQAE
jgi:hypothetical protein